MYAWEIPFQKVVSEARANELKEIRIASYLRVVFLGFMMFTERTALFLTILVFVLFGNTMTANVVSKSLLEKLAVNICSMRSETKEIKRKYRMKKLTNWLVGQT